MKILLKDVKVGERMRKVFEGIDELAESIATKGLLHPIVIDENNHLIAGERRYKAHQLLKMTEIEVTYKKDLTTIEKMEIELEENLMRKNFSWQEEVSGKQQVHKLKQQIHGAAVKGHDTEGTWKVKDTAVALGESVGSVSMDLQLARGMKAFPALMKEKSKTAAFKKLKQLQEGILQEELSKRIKSSGAVERPDVICGSCIEEMAKMPAESVDLIVTDPPYGIDIGEAQTFGKSSPQNTGYVDSEFETFDMLDKAIKEMYRVLKNDRHMYMFFGIDKYDTIVSLLRKHGFEVHHLPLIWDKGSGSYPSQSTSFVHSYEPFLHISKGRRKLNGTPRDVFSVKRVPSNRKIHPSEKPCSLLRDLIGFSSLPGEVVLDPFSGSGATLVAAKECSRRGIGIELNSVYHENIVKRLERGESNGEEEV